MVMFSKKVEKKKKLQSKRKIINILPNESNDKFKRKATFIFRNERSMAERTRDEMHFTHRWNSNAVQVITRLEGVDARYTMCGELI